MPQDCLLPCRQTQALLPQSRADVPKAGIQQFFYKGSNAMQTSGHGQQVNKGQRPVLITRFPGCTLLPLPLGLLFSKRWQFGRRLCTPSCAWPQTLCHTPLPNRGASFRAAQFQRRAGAMTQSVFLKVTDEGQKTLRERGESELAGLGVPCHFSQH